MSTQNVPVYNQYLGNGVATQFSIGFPYLNRDYVKVYLLRKDGAQELLDSTRYTFVNDKVIEFPTLPTDTVLNDGDVLTIQRETPLGSDYEFDNQKRLFPVEVMNADDLSFQQIQELAREIKRAIKTSPTDTTTGDGLLQKFNQKVVEAKEAAVDSENSATASASSVSESKAQVDRAQGIVDAFDANAAQKQAQIDASVEEARKWAVGTISEQPQGSAKHWAEEAEKSALVIKTSSFGNIGDIKYTSRTDVPNGGAWCDGALYTKAQFPDVYQMLVDGKLQSTTVSEFDSSVSANGSCGFFGLDTSNERFKVPMLKDVYLKAGQAPSMFGAESLSNVKGKVGSIGDYDDTAVVTEAFKRVEKQIHGVGGGNIVSCYNATFDASRSSSTDQNGAKVNPDHVVYRAYVVLYASAAEASVAQASEFITALGGKANTDLSNVSSNIDYIVESEVNSSGSWYRKYKSGWLEQGGIGLTVGINGTKTVTLIKPFKNTKYIVNWLDQDGFMTTGEGTRGIRDKTTTSFTACNGQDRNMNIGWIAIGQGA